MATAIVNLIVKARNSAGLRRITEHLREGAERAKTFDQALSRVNAQSVSRAISSTASSFSSLARESGRNLSNNLREIGSEFRQIGTQASRATAGLSSYARETVKSERGLKGLGRVLGLTDRDYRRLNNTVRQGAGIYRSAVGVTTGISREIEKTLLGNVRAHTLLSRAIQGTSTAYTTVRREFINARISMEENNVTATRLANNVSSRLGNAFSRRLVPAMHRARSALLNFVSTEDRAIALTRQLNHRLGQTHEVMRGVGRVANNTSRQFASIASGVGGGLVPLYAGLAANVFALSASFEFLRRAGDLRVLNQGQVAYASSTGQAMRSLTNAVIDATEAQIAYEDAAQATAIGLAAGLNPDQLTRLGTAARDVAVILGRDVTDSFNRLIRGVTKAEPELLDELGIVLRLKEATTDYAAALGIGANDLTAFQRSQAVANDVLRQAEERYGRILKIVDPSINSINQLGVAFDETFRTFRRNVSAAVEPLSNLLVESDRFRTIFSTIGAAGLLGATFSEGFNRASQRFTEFGNQLTRQAHVRERLLRRERKNLSNYADSLAKVNSETRNRTRLIGEQLLRAGASPTPGSGSVADLVQRGQLDQINLRQGSRQRRAVRQQIDILRLRAGDVRNELTTAQRATIVDAERQITNHLNRIDRTTSVTFRSMTDSTNLFFRRTALGFLQLRAGAQRAASFITRTVGRALNSLLVLSLAFSVGSYFVAFIRDATAAEKDIDPIAERIDFLTDNLKSMNEEFARFNQIQAELTREGGGVLNYFGALGNRISSLSFDNQVFIFEEAIARFQELQQQAERERDQIVAGTQAAFGPILSDLPTRTVTLADVFDTADADELLGQINSQIQDLGRELTTIEQNFGPGTAPLFEQYLRDLEGFRTAITTNIDTAETFAQRLVEQIPHINQFTDTFNRYQRAVQENRRTENRILSQFIPTSDEESLAGTLQSELNDNIAIFEVIQGNTEELEQQRNILRSKIQLLRDIDRQNHVAALNERAITAEYAQRNNLLTATQNTLDGLNREQDTARAEITALNQRISIIERVPELFGFENEQKEKAIQLAQAELLIARVQLRNLEDRVAIETAFQERAARNALLRFNNEQFYTTLLNNQTDSVQEIINLEKERAEIADNLADARSRLRRLSEERRAAGVFVSEEERSAQREIDSLVRGNMLLEDRIRLLEQQRRQEEQLGQLRDRNLLFQANIGGTQFQQDALNFELDRARIDERRLEINNKLNDLDVQRSSIPQTLQEVVRYAQQFGQDVDEVRKTAAEVNAELDDQQASLERQLNIENAKETSLERQRRIALDILRLNQEQEAVGLALSRARDSVPLQFTDRQREEFEFSLRRLEIGEQVNEIERERAEFLTQAQGALTAEGRERIRLFDIAVSNQQFLLELLNEEERRYLRLRDIRERTEDAVAANRIRTAALSIGATQNEREIVQFLSRQSEILAEREEVLARIAIFEEDRDAGRVIDERALLAQYDRLTVLELQTQELRRQTNATSQLIDTARQGFESNFQAQLAQLIKAENSSITDAILAIGQGVLRSVGDNLAKTITNAILGNDPIQIAQRQGQTIGREMISAGQEVAGMFRNAITGTEEPGGMIQAIPDADSLVESTNAIENVLNRSFNRFADIFESISTGFSSLFSGDFSSLFGLFGFANGGIASGGFRALQDGGVITRPTIGLVGEGRFDEAVVPLPDGRSIPVQVTGSGGGSTSVEVNVYITNDGQAETQVDSNQGADVGQAVAAAVQRELQKQKRPGGMLNRYGVA